MPYPKQNYFQRRTRSFGARANHYIKAREVQVISSEGKNLGVLNTNEAIKIANIMTCNLSGDHRVIDGAVGAKLLKVFKSNIENPIKMLV